VRNANFRVCVLSARNCTEGSQCAIKALCGNGAMRGSGSCNQTMMCQRSCGTDVACGCTCMANMSPDHARAITVLDACAMRCGGDENCINTRCQIALAACAQQ
jgi:hypothetical protein